MHHKCQNPQLRLLICYSLSAISGDRKRKRPKSNFLRDGSLYFEKVRSINFLVRMKVSHNLHNVCQNTFCAQRKWILRLIILDNTRKRWPMFSFHWMNRLFMKNLCFQQHLGCYRENHITCPMFAILLSPLYMETLFNYEVFPYKVDPWKVFPDVCNVQNYEREIANFFSLERCPFLIKTWALNILGVTERNL